jgi:HEAT repeat protein
MKEQSIPRHLPEGLIQQLSARKGSVREQAREALVEMGPAVVPALLELVRSPTKRERWEAAKALSTIAAPSSTSALAKLLSDPESDIRWMGAVGLIRIGPDSIPYVLRVLIKKPNSTGVRRAAHHVLRDLSREHPELLEILSPVLDSLGDSAPADILPPRRCSNWPAKRERRQRLPGKDSNLD